MNNSYYMILLPHQSLTALLIDAMRERGATPPPPSKGEMI